MDLQEAILDKEAFREELRTQKLKVAKLVEQNLKIPDIHQELKDIRTMVHAKDVETQKCGKQLQNIKGRHERLRVNRNDLVEELEKINKHDQKKTKPLYILTLDATIVSCHLFDVFPAATKENLSLQNYCLYCVYPSLSLLYLPPKPLEPIENEWR